MVYKENKKIFSEQKRGTSYYNDLLQDAPLDVEEYAVLVYLLSNSDNRVINKFTVAKRFNNMTDNKAKNILTRLKKKKYIKQRGIKKPDGKMDGSVYDVYEKPYDQ